MTHITTMTSKGQITIPVALREKLGMLPGEKIEVKLHDNHLIVTSPVDIATAREKNQNFLKKRRTSISTENIDRARVDSLRKKYF